MKIDHRIDFLLVIVAEKCNPNGDPGADNTPRQDIGGFGEISDVCLKRKIRNRMQDMGYPILNVSEERTDDGLYSIKDRLNACDEFKTAMNEKTKNIYDKINTCKSVACRRWMDVRTFGQLFPFKGGNEVSFSVRGPVSISLAKSIAPIIVEPVDLTKSLNTETVSDRRKDSATMGRKYIIDKGAYIAKGSIYPQLASLTGFTVEDADILHECLKTLFENDSSASRPAGSMDVSRLYWWDHSDGNRIPSPAAVFHTLSFKPTEEYPFYRVTGSENCLDPDIYEGMLLP